MDDFAAKAVADGRAFIDEYGSLITLNELLFMEDSINPAYDGPMGIFADYQEEE